MKHFPTLKLPTTFQVQSKTPSTQTCNPHICSLCGHKVYKDPHPPFPFFVIHLVATLYARSQQTQLLGLQIVRSRWGMDPFTRGSYSYVSAVSSPSDIDLLEEPLAAGGLPVVCFAGEATSRKHIGTTAGAYFSGVREAVRVIGAHRLGRCP